MPLAAGGFATIGDMLAWLVVDDWKIIEGWKWV